MAQDKYPHSKQKRGTSETKWGNKKHYNNICQICSQSRKETNIVSSGQAEEERYSDIGSARQR